MKILADCHTHSSFSGDSDEPMENMIKKAIDLNLKYICFTEHHDIDFPCEYGDFYLDIPKYLEHANIMKEKYKNDINVLIGIELGLLPQDPKKCKAIVDKYDFDFVIGSTHLIDMKDPYLESYWDDITEEDGYRRYFENILTNVHNFKDYDVYAHLDYVVRYGPNTNKNYSYKKYADLFDEILKTIINDGKGIEINSSGYKYKLGNPHPHLDVLQRYYELGGEIITFGSDSHDVNRITADFEKIHEIVKKIGFKYYTVYENRKAKFLKL